MNITVIVCTYNRCAVLPVTLNSVAASVLPDSVAWEVLVVDNNSGDQTREVAEGFCRQYPCRFRYVFEGRPGKSYALNRGIQEARGEILAFADDDVVLETTWLCNLTAALRSDEWAGTGGRTLPMNTVPLPRWLSLRDPYSLGGILAALFDLGDEPLELDQAPFGANMAFPKKMFVKYGGFRTDLGPSPDNKIPRPNEDTEFGRRLMAAGEHLRYEPLAVAYHPIIETRLQKAYFLHWWFDYGRALVREAGKRPAVWGVPRHYLSIARAGGRMLRETALWALDLNPPRRFHRKCAVWKAVGQIVEFHRQSRTRVGIGVKC